MTKFLYPEDESHRDPIHDFNFTEIDDLLEFLKGNTAVVDTVSEFWQNGKTQRTKEAGSTFYFKYPAGFMNYSDKTYPLDPTVGYLGENDWMYSVSDTAAGLQKAKEIVEDLNNGYYGELDIYLTEADNQTDAESPADGSSVAIRHRVDTTASGSSNDPNAKPVATNKYTVKLRFDDGDDSNPINKVTWGGLVAANGAAIAKDDARVNNGTFDGDVTKPTAFKTLAGISLPFTLCNNRVESWGVEDVDFEKSTIELVYLGLNGTSGEEVVYTTNFTNIGEADQTFIFPEKLEGDSEYENGYYTVRVKVAVKSFEHTDPYTYTAKLRLNTMSADNMGGIKSVFVAESNVLGGFGERIVNNGNTGASVERVTVPVIETITVSGWGENSLKYFLNTWMTYQNENVGDDAAELVETDSVLLKCWIGDKEKPTGDVVYAKIGYSDNLGMSSESADSQALIGSRFTGFHILLNGQAGSNGVSWNDHFKTLTLECDGSESEITLYMQEVYSNGESSAIKQVQVIFPRGDNAITPTLDLADDIDNPWNAIPGEKMEIGVKDISSLNGAIKYLFVAPGDTVFTKTNSYPAKITTLEGEADEHGAQSVRKVLSIATTHGFAPAESANYVDALGMEGEAKQLINDLAVDGGQAKNFRVVAVDENYNITVFDSVSVLCGLDPYAPTITGNPVKEDGNYTVRLTMEDLYAPLKADLKKARLVITTVDPETSDPDEGRTTDEAKTTNTIVISWDELVAAWDKGSQQQTGAPLDTIYDGSTSNTPGVYSLGNVSVGYYRNNFNNYDDTAGFTPNSWKDGEPTSQAWRTTLTVKGAIPDADTTVYIYCEDELGHRSEVIEIAGEERPEPKIVEGTVARAEDGSIQVDFTQGVVITSPELIVTDNRFTTQKTGLPFYTDGTYQVEYMDIFGKSYTGNLVVALDEEDWLKGLKYTLAPSFLTNSDVTFSVSTAEGDTVTQITSVTVEGKEGVTPTIADDKHSATLVVTENCTIVVTFTHGEQVVTKKFPVTNIDKYMAKTEITWEYGSDDVYGTDGNIKKSGSTSGLVTAIVVIAQDETVQPDEKLTGTNGELRFTFPNGSKAGDTHVFTYTDAAGNTGTITATLPFDIELPIPPRLTAYSMTVSHTAQFQTWEDDRLRYDATGDSETNTNFEEYRWYKDESGKKISAQTDILNIDTNVDAEIRLLTYGSRDITAALESDVVTLSGKNIQITDKVSFTIALVEDPKYEEAAQGSENEGADKGGQKILYIDVVIDNIVILPQPTIRYVKESNFKRRAYIEWPEGVNEEDMTILNPLTEGETLLDSENGKYYHLFEGNGDYVFRYQDEVGNVGTVTASVEDIPEKDVEKVGGFRWWPYDKGDQSALPEDPVNYDVTVQINFNMAIEKAELRKTNSDDSEKVSDTIATVATSVDMVTVTFHANSEAIYLYVVGESGEVCYVEIPAVSIIDKVAPEITVDGDKGAAAQELTVTLTPNEPVTCEEVPTGGARNEEGYFDVEHPMVLIVTANGEYTYTFVDKAGNKTVEPLTITQIDREAPRFLFSATGGEDADMSWADYTAAHDENELNSGETITVYIKANENCNYSLQGKNGTFTKDEWTPLTIDRDSTDFTLIAQDSVGNTSMVMFTGIRPIDKTAPFIQLPSQNTSIALNTSEEDAKALLLEGVTVTDNSGEEIKPEIDMSELNLAVKGEYTVRYTATDSSGNSITVERYVRVFDSTELLLQVSDDGGQTYVDAGYMCTVVLDNGVLSFKVSGLKGSDETGHETYTIYIKKGFKTAGQMKNGSTLVTGDQVTVDGTGYYTVWVLTQTREQYLTYLYIEQ